MNAEVKNKLEKVKKYISDKNLDGILLNKATNFAWLTGGIDVHGPELLENAVASLLVTKDKVYLIGPCVETSRMKAEVTPGLDIEIADYPWHWGSLEQKLGELVNPSKVASDIPLAGTKPVETDFQRFKYAYCPEEIKRAEWLGRETGLSIEKTAFETKPGETEFEVLAKCNESLWKKGIRPVVMYIAADERAMNYKHPLTIGKKIDKHMIFVVMTMKWGMMVALSRLVFFAKVPEEYRKKQNAVMKVDATYILNTKPGAVAGDILRKGVQVYSEQGYEGYWKDQFQGGPTGYELRNYFTNFETKEIVELNQAFAWNPMINGLKSEDTFIVTETNPNFVTMTGNWPVQKIEIDGLTVERPDILVK